MPSKVSLTKLKAKLCNETKMCDCATEIEKRDKIKKINHSAQTDPLGPDFAAIFSGIGSMFDNVGAWVPYIGGSAIFILMLGVLSRNLDKLLGMFDLEYDEMPTVESRPESVSPPKESACQVQCAFRISKDKIRWP